MVCLFGDALVKDGMRELRVSQRWKGVRTQERAARGLCQYPNGIGS